MAFSNTLTISIKKHLPFVFVLCLPIFNLGCGFVEEGVSKLGDEVIYGGKKDYTIAVDPVSNDDGNNPVVYIYASNVDEYYYKDGSGHYTPSEPYLSTPVELREYDHLKLTLWADSEHFKIGNIWVIRSGRKIKLLTESSLEGDIILQDFKVDEDLFKRAQEGFGSSMSSYMLSGGLQGSEPISATYSLTLTKNGVEIMNVVDGNIQPITLDLAIGDSLGIAARSDPGDILGEIWLHHPNGYAEKINHSLAPHTNADSPALSLSLTIKEGKTP